MKRPRETMQGIMKQSRMGERERKQREGSESQADGVMVVGKYVCKSNEEMTESHKKIMLREL